MFVLGRVYLVHSLCKQDFDEGSQIDTRKDKKSISRSACGLGGLTAAADGTK
jgi:hypothetical protein